MWCATETQEVHSNKRKHTLFEHQHPHNHHLHCSIQQWVVPTLVVIIVYKLNIAAWQIRIMSISNVVHHILIWTNDLLTATILFVMTTSRPRTAGPQIVTCFSACNHRHFPRRETHKKICWGIYPKQNSLHVLLPIFAKCIYMLFGLFQKSTNLAELAGGSGVLFLFVPSAMFLVWEVLEQASSVLSLATVVHLPNFEYGLWIC